MAQDHHEEEVLGKAYDSRLMKRLRVKGEGPTFRRHCRFVQYHIDDLDAWSVAQATREVRHG